MESEQALKISSLAARLELQRHNAEALAHDATSQLSMQLHDSLAEVIRVVKVILQRVEGVTSSLGNRALLLEPYWRMVSEQALKISSLAARLELQRHNAEALAHDATSQLSVQLHDSLAEVQRLKEELDTKDKQLARLRQSAGDRDASEKDDSTHGDSCNTKDKITILERELSSAQSRLAQLTSVVQALETDREVLTRRLKDAHRVIAEKKAQVDELMALKLDDDDMQKSEQKSEVIEGKTSARTLSDIVSISDFDEQDLQMRRAELRQNTSLNAPYVTETRDKMANRTLPPDVQRANMSSLNIDFTDHFELGHFTPRADSLPLQFTSTQTKDSIKNFKRNINETTIFGTADRFGDSVKHSTAVNIPDNCSMYPNRDVNDSKGHSVDPKKIDFSLEPSQDNKTNDDNEFTSLRELGIVLDIKQENFPDILSQLKHEIKKSKSELDVCKTELKYAEEQLCEFPALKEEVEELKGLLENTMATMETDKKFYENQLDQFSTNKKNMEQRLAELSQEVNDKSKDLHLLKEDILRRENMILELAKEKRNLTNKMTELEVKIDELQSRNTALEKFEFENHQLRDKVAELQKLQQLVSEKNQQIDSLNQHLDRLDDLQRNLNDKTEEFESLKEAFEEKSNELFQMQDTVEALNRDLANVHEDNNKLNLSNKELKLKLTKLEKEQENQSLKLQSHETELERVNSLNTELTSKIEELKDLTDKLKDKETEIEILNEDINSYHEEIASLKEQLKMVSRSPSPKSKNEDERSRDRQASNDKKQLVKIRKQISLLQHELDFNKKELNDKAFELAKARLDVTELKSTLSQESKLLAERDQENRRLEEAERTLRQEVEALTREKQGLGEQLELVMCRIREESNIDELRQKLQEKTEQCEVLERELIDMRDKLERMRSPPHEDSCALVVSGTRSPTAELERALRDQLDYSRRLDVDIMEQVLSASSDNEEIPRLMLHSSKSSSSIESSSSERAHRLRSDNDKLQLQVTHLEMQVTHLETRLRDKDALITELNRIRDKLVSDWQAAKLRYEAERDNSGRLQLLLDSQKETCDSLQKQDSSMINILKKRLESSMATELELQQQVQHYRARLATYEAQSPPASPAAQHADTIERLRGETSVLKSRLDVERSRRGELQVALEVLSAQAQRENNGKSEQINELRQELAEIRRLKHEAGLELVRAQELLHIQAGTIRELERKLSAVGKQRPIDDALTEIEEHKSSLTREISSLKKCLLESAATERSDTVAQLRAEKQALQETVSRLQNQAQLDARPAEDKEQAIRYLHGRCLRLESCRKALVWQKRYLQRVVAGYTQLEARLQLPTRAGTGQGRHRFRCIATVVIIVLRMGFLVRRRLAARALSANCLLRAPTGRRDVTQTPCSEYGPTPPARPAPLRRALHNDLRRHQLLSPLGDLPRFNPNSPRDDPFILNTPRSEAPSYLNKVDLVSRCLNQAMDTSRDVS
ncbi:early endosome antigen 1 [Plutella xylostella]|uniref:early endosome antigen 1 n=1 Tax=Plutella xylostella TaxID=51655 RepID=UPI002032C694|nr:early endosome antigen 1 [Plutella xylostella]